MITSITEQCNKVILSLYPPLSFFLSLSTLSFSPILFLFFIPFLYHSQPFLSLSLSLSPNLFPPSSFSLFHFFLSLTPSSLSHPMYLSYILSVSLSLSPSLSNPFNPLAPSLFLSPIFFLSLPLPISLAYLLSFSLSHTHFFSLLSLLFTLYPLPYRNSGPFY